MYYVKYISSIALFKIDEYFWHNYNVFNTNLNREIQIARVTNFGFKY